MASNLSKQVQRIERSISLLGMLYDRLRYLQQPMTGLVAALADMEQFAGIRFLQACRASMAEGEPFPLSWQHGVKADAPVIGREHARALLPLGEILGSTDLDSQLTSIRHTIMLLENQLQQARAYREKHSKLYQSMGVLGGMAIAVVFI